MAAPGLGPAASSEATRPRLGGCREECVMSLMLHPCPAQEISGYRAEADAAETDFCKCDILTQCTPSKQFIAQISSIVQKASVTVQRIPDGS